MDKNNNYTEETPIFKNGKSNNLFQVRKVSKIGTLNN